jgi:hypothetical protein
MESIFYKVDENHIISLNDFISNPIPFQLKDCAHIGFFAKTRGGKSNAVSQLLQHHLLFKFRPEDIYIFSPSFNSDSVY